MKKKNIGLYIIFISIILVIFILLNAGLNQGVELNNSNNSNIQYYKSINELISKCPLENIEIPGLIKEQTDLNISSIMGMLIEISNNTMVLKIAPFVDNNADTLGLYDKSTIDNKYTIDKEETKINFFRYRTGYGEYPNCTIINWCTDDTSYGFMIEKKISEDEALRLIELNKDWLVTNTEKIVGTENTYKIGNYMINLPSFKSEFKLRPGVGMELAYINSKLSFVFIYDLELNKEAFKGKGEIQLNDDILLRYLEENPFDKGSEAYNDYELFINTIDSIKNTMVYQE